MSRALGFPYGITGTRGSAAGFTETDMTVEQLAGEKNDKRRAESPLGNVNTVEEVSTVAVVFLAYPGRRWRAWHRAQHKRHGAVPPDVSGGSLTCTGIELVHAGRR